MDEEESDWSTSWRVHEHTAKLKKEATVARDTAEVYLFNACVESQDPKVQGAYQAYLASQRMLEIFTTGQWP